jgi:hypothetical protein
VTSTVHPGGGQAHALGPLPFFGSPARLLPVYFTAHALAVFAYWFVPRGSWAHCFWQSVATSLCMVFMLLGVRHSRPEAAIGWYFIAAGVFVNAWGVVVEKIVLEFFGVTRSPSAADVFWSTLFPSVVVGMLLLLRRVVAREQLTATILNTAICVSVLFFTSIHAWQFVAWRTYLDENVALPYKLIVTAYSFGDLMFLALLLRLFLGVGLRNVTLLLMVCWLVLLLPSDLGWPTVVRSGRPPSRLFQYFMESTWMTSSAILGAATWHPDVRAITRSIDGRVAAIGPLGWIGLLVCLLIGPIVVLLQVLLDRIFSVTSF